MVANRLGASAITAPGAPMISASFGKGRVETSPSYPTSDPSENLTVRASASTATASAP